MMATITTVIKKVRIIKWMHRMYKTYRLVWLTSYHYKPKRTLSPIRKDVDEKQPR